MAKNRFAVAGTAFLFAFGLIAAAVAPAQAQTTGLMNYCEVAFTGCPQDYHGRELVVPLNVIAISSQIQACGYSDSVAQSGSGGTPPSVVFVIDQSSSMYDAGKDRAGNRFLVTSALIDSIFRVQPLTEVGVVVFRDDLIFTHSHDSNLVRLNNRGAYLPFVTLNDNSANIVRGGVFGTDSSHSPGGLNGYDVIKNILKVRDSTLVTITGSGNRRDTTYVDVKDIAYFPWYGNSGTNVTRAFDAARAILANAKNDRDNQFIIFISDGEANRPSGNNNTTELNRYIRGDSIPVTFTVFFDNLTIPPQLTQMTENIANNGWSVNNPNSEIWRMSSDYDSLLTLMMDNIITPMLSKSEGSAKSIVISSAGVNDSTGAMNDIFTFSRRLPIDTSEITTIGMGVRYDVRIDSVVTQPIPGTNRDTTYTITVRNVRDSLFNYEFTVRRTANPALSLAEQGLSSNCGTSPTLTLLFQNDSLASTKSDIVKEAKGNMDTLRVVFDNSGGLFNYNSVLVEIRNADGSAFVDIVNLTMTRGIGADSSIWTISFPRMESTVADLTDKKLQHAKLDSIVVVFRNPDIPLDTLRISVPYISSSMAFYDKPDNPANATQYPDALTVTAGDSLNIYAKFFNEMGLWDAAMESDPSKITWQVNGTNVTADGVHYLFQYETAGTYTVTATYRDGPLSIARSIVITVRPGAPHYLQIVTDTTNIANKVDTASITAGQDVEFNKNTNSVVLYIVERDKFGNRITGDDAGTGVTWNVVTDNRNTNITIQVQDGGKSAVVSREGSNFEDGLRVTAEKTDMRPDKVDVSAIGPSTTGIGPNPFVPGTSIEDGLGGRGSVTYTYYSDIINNSRSNTGALVAATPPRRVKTNATGTPMASVLIYDAVGNIVFRSGPNDIKMAAAPDNPTFGFIWDGKNNAGRTVGPGTYLLRITATLSNGEKYSEARKIGVTSKK